MTVDDAIKTLQGISSSGKGHYPLQFMVCDSGITYADDVYITEGQPGDGDLVWIFTLEERNHT